MDRVAGVEGGGRLSIPKKRDCRAFKHSTGYSQTTTGMYVRLYVCMFVCIHRKNVDNKMNDNLVYHEILIMMIAGMLL